MTAGFTPYCYLQLRTKIARCDDFTLDCTPALVDSLSKSSHATPTSPASRPPGPRRYPRAGVLLTSTRAPGSGAAIPHCCRAGDPFWLLADGPPWRAGSGRTSGRAGRRGWTGRGRVWGGSGAGSLSPSGPAAPRPAAAGPPGAGHSARSSASAAPRVSCSRHPPPNLLRPGIGPPPAPRCDLRAAFGPRIAAPPDASDQADGATLCATPRPLWPLSPCCLLQRSSYRIPWNDARLGGGSRRHGLRGRLRLSAPAVAAASLGVGDVGACRPPASRPRRGRPGRGRIPGGILRSSPPPANQRRSGWTLAACAHAVCLLVILPANDHCSWDRVDPGAAVHRTLRTWASCSREDKPGSRGITES